ncbi:hypothetical protein OROHE_018402 [Orobanche hederae]
MDADPESNFGVSSQSTTHGYRINSSTGNDFSTHVLPAACAFCHRLLSSDDDNTSDHDAISVCGDCKLLLLANLETNSPDIYHTRPSRGRYDSSESIGSMFSQQFSQLINLARQNRSTVSEHDYQSVDGDLAARLVQHTTSSRTTPSGSRRWRRLFSDTESDGLDSLYGESESNVSFRRYSYSSYGGDSDDGGSFMENENFGDLESDTDIDPMNAGYQWDSEDEDDSEWEEADIERNTHEALRGGDHHVRGLSRSNSDMLNNFEESEARNYVGESGEYLDARGFGLLLERFVETGSSRRGAPPASESYISNMPCITINEDKLESMACAICKDSFSVGTVVNQLPCFHIFHPLCILPWFSTRNTCPLCRHEVPTDDKDYQVRPLDVSGGDVMVDEPSRFHNDGAESDVANEELVGNGVARDVMRNKWFFLAAPIVGIVGVTLMLCFGSSLQDRRCRVPSRRENSQRSWWSFL